MSNKEDHAEVTLGILIKIPPNLLLDLSPITFGRIKMFSKFIFLCLQNMVSGQLVEYRLRPDTANGGSSSYQLFCNTDRW